MGRACSCCQREPTFFRQMLLDQSAATAAHIGQWSRSPAGSHDRRSGSFYPWDNAIRRARGWAAHNLVVGRSHILRMLHLRQITTRSRIAALCLLLAATWLLGTPTVWPPDGGFSMAYNLLIFSAFALLLVALSGGRKKPPLQLLRFFANFA